jgi:hypothetical protein
MYIESETMHMHNATRVGKRALLALAVAAPIAMVGAAAPALATPKGPYAVFAQCPTGTPGVELCTYAQTTSGEFVVGNTKVPINKTITLQGGAIPDPAEVNAFFLVPAKNGESLSKTELNVPGGLLNIINCEEIKGNGFFETAARNACKAIFENGTTGVTATTELVANEHNPAIFNLGNIFAESGTTLTLPVRVHLKNPLLGNHCYIGSESHPIQLHLTTGTTSPPPPNKPIKGNRGTFAEEEEVLVINNNSLVDNAFPAPEAEGCGEFLFVNGFLDSIVNGKIGLPAAAGHNTAILTGTLRAATAEAVVKSE